MSRERPEPTVGGRNRRAYGGYIILLLIVFILARFPTHPIMRYAFLASLIAFFAYTGALPYLAAPVAKGEPGWMRHAFIKIAFPVLAVLGIVLVAALLIKIGF